MKVILDRIRASSVTGQPHGDGAAGSERNTGCCFVADDQCRTLAEQITGIDRPLGRLYDALEAGKVTVDDLSPRIAELRSRRAQVQKGIAELTRVAEAKENLVERSAYVWRLLPKGRRWLAIQREKTG